MVPITQIPRQAQRGRATVQDCTAGLELRASELTSQLLSVPHAEFPTYVHRPQVTGVQCEMGWGHTAVLSPSALATCPASLQLTCPTLAPVFITLTSQETPPHTHTGPLDRPHGPQCRGPGDDPSPPPAAHSQAGATRPYLPGSSPHTLGPRSLEFPASQAHMAASAHGDRATLLPAALDLGGWDLSVGREVNRKGRRPW